MDGTGRSNPRAGRGADAPGFTLVELLVVVAVIAILMGALLPALGGAQRSSRLIASLNNLRQISAASVSYSHDNSDRWPVIPLVEPAPGKPGAVLFNSWTWGGKTTDEFWASYAGGLNHVTASERVLNPYVYDSVDFDGPGDEFRADLPVFRCPGDSTSHQRNYWAERLILDPISSYDDVGTSYHMNMKWWFFDRDAEAVRDNTPERWNEMRQLFRKATFRAPSRFVWVHDQVMDIVAVREFDREGQHGGLNRSAVGFMDGHVEYVRTEPGEFVTTDYRLILD